MHTRVAELIAIFLILYKSLPMDVSETKEIQLLIVVKNVKIEYGKLEVKLDGITETGFGN